MGFPPVPHDLNNSTLFSVAANYHKLSLSNTSLLLAHCFVGQQSVSLFGFPAFDVMVLAGLRSAPWRLWNRICFPADSGCWQNLPF